MSLLSAKYNKEYDIQIEAWGDGIICEENFEGRLDSIFELYGSEYMKEPEDVSFYIKNPYSYGLDYGFTGIDSLFLERIEHLKELIIADTIKEIRITDKLEEILKANNTLIRGSLDSYAEEFAAEQGLNFRSENFVFARDMFERIHEDTAVTMIFKRDGSVVASEVVSSPGSSAGNTFGGTFYKELPSDFWNAISAEDIAEMYSKRIREAIIKDGILASFIEKAKTHKLFRGNNK